MFGEHFAKRLKHIRLGFEAILVQVIAALASAAQREIASEKGEFRNPFSKLFTGHTINDGLEGAHGQSRRSLCDRISSDQHPVAQRPAWRSSIARIVIAVRI